MSCHNRDNDNNSNDINNNTESNNGTFKGIDNENDNNHNSKNIKLTTMGNQGRLRRPLTPISRSATNTPFLV